MSCHRFIIAPILFVLVFEFRPPVGSSYEFNVLQVAKLQFIAAKQFAQRSEYFLKIIYFEQIIVYFVSVDEFVKNIVHIKSFHEQFILFISTKFVF